MSTARITPSGTGKPFPSAPRAEGGGSLPLPAMLGRGDIRNGRWTTSECRPVRGEPMTDLANRVMLTPADDSDLSRCIRGHEMIHAKVSPTPEQMVEWIGREIASHTALIAAEELRVNFLAKKAGFPVDKHLADGSEQAHGEMCAKRGDWAAAVAMTIATAGTAGHKKFLTGVRRYNRDWGKELKAIATKALAEARRVYSQGGLAHTGTYGGGEMAPYGFYFTERLAEWLDRLASFPPSEDRKGEGKSEGEGAGAGGDGEPRDGEREIGGESHGDSPPDRKGEPRAKTVRIDRSGSRPVEWYPLVVKRLPMTRFSKGNLGKRRIATNIGRRPRRIHRLMTDPAKRVFDRTVRGTGGMVLIDGSGSMSLTIEQVAEMTAFAGGCTVAVYSHRTYGRSADKPNLWVLADRGRMVENLDGADYGYGNGVDYPALAWAEANRTTKRVPIVWVCDGYVTGSGDRMSNLLILQCVEFVKRHNVLIAETPEDAIAMLRKLENGVHVPIRFPEIMRSTYREMCGVTLP